MIAYSLRVLSLIRELREAHPNFTQPWYADNSGSGGTSPRILAHLDNIMTWEPPQGYFLDLTKSILVVSTHNVAQEEILLCGWGMTIVIGSRYLGGYIGDMEPQAEWMSKKVRD